MVLVLELPFPPSVNRIWRSVLVRGRCMTLLSRAGREYRKRVAEAVTVAHAGVLLTTRLSVTIEVYPPNKRRLDCHNRTKALLDALEHAGVYEDDSQVKELHVYERALCRPEGKVIVTISELAEKGD